MLVAIFLTLDAGKSTIGGHLLYLTGMVDQRTLDKYEKESKELNRESWYFSWALDTNEEERMKGITVEAGMAHFETEHRKFTVLDAPGHKNYVPNMISAAAQADVAILVISARKGEFEAGFEKEGQTREHAMLVKTAGVERLIVVINKMDESTVNWSKERFDECVSKLTHFLKGCGFNPKTQVVFIPISGFTGANLKIKVRSEECDWYSGPTLLEYLDSMPSIERVIFGSFMMPVTDKFKDMGTVVSGKVESGQLRKGMNVVLMPINRPCEVVGIYDDEDEIDSTQCGDNVKIKLKGVEDEEVQQGFVLCGTMKPVKVANTFIAQLVFETIPSIVSIGFTSMIHIHTCVEHATIESFICKIDRKTLKKSKLKLPCARSRDVVIVKIRVQQGICVEAFDDYPQLGRFTLRSKTQTIARGKVLKVIQE